MKQVYVECWPDGRLVSRLGFTKKFITHSKGKAKVLDRISKTSNSLALVDEDPGKPKHPYESKMVLKEEKSGIKLYEDHNNNRILVLSIKLEDWIISVCKSQKVDLQEFGLPSDPKHLKDIINQNLDKFGGLIDELLEQNNPAILQLKSWLQ